MRRPLAGAAAVVALLADGAALACGGFFGEQVNVDPNQDIIIAWKNGVETYVFQPTFCGSARSFGLMLPVPAILASEPSLVEQEAFTTAAALSEPEKREVAEKSGTGCGASNDSDRAADDEVTTSPVVASGRVGFLDWTQLRADTKADLTAWLDANGYPYSTSASDAFTYYVSKSWYFLAFRISSDLGADGGTVCQAFGPVSVSFPTSTPVVPSRMGSANVASSGAYTHNWRIFGITSGDAQISLLNSSNQYDGFWYSGAISAADAPSFGDLATQGDRLTRLILTFHTGSTEADKTLVLATPKDYRGYEEVYVKDSACSAKPRARLSQGRLVSLLGIAILGLFALRWRVRAAQR